MDAIPNTPVANNQQHQVSPDEKILKDLDTLMERINLGNEMIQQNGFRVDLSPGGRDETMLQVLGFLKACQPRMVELVEAAAQGALQEGTLMRCLEVNDLLAKALDFESGKKEFGRAKASTCPQTDDVAKAAPKYDDLDDLLFGDEVKKSSTFQQPSKLGANTVDPFAGETLFESDSKPSLKSDPLLDMAEDEKKPSSTLPNSGEMDDFDSFLLERSNKT